MPIIGSLLIDGLLWGTILLTSYRTEKKTTDYSPILMIYICGGMLYYINTGRSKEELSFAITGYTSLYLVYQTIHFLLKIDYFKKFRKK